MWRRTHRERIDLLIECLTDLSDTSIEESARSRALNEAIGMLRQMKNLPPDVPADSEVYVNFKPTATNINALSEPLRNYIHDLETRTDPSGDLREIAALKEQREALLAKLRELESEH